MSYELFPWQAECLARWSARQRKGCVNAVTGSGKTLLAMFAILRLEEDGPRPLRVKVVVPTVAILNQWLGTFHAFFSEKHPGTYDRSQLGCWYGGCKCARRYTVYVVNSARDALPRHIREDIAAGFDVFLIADEYHHYESPENRRIFSFLPLPDPSRYHALGLSATPAGSLAPLGPEVYRYGFSQALEQGRVCPYAILQVELSFTAAELEEYADYSAQMSALGKKLKRTHPGLSDAEGGAFFAAIRHLASESGGGDETARSYLNLTYLRKSLVCMARSRVDCLLALLPKFGPDSRILVFCERIEQAEEAYRRLLPFCGGRVGRCHSALSGQANHNTLRAFRENEIRVLIACRSLDEGIDVPDAGIGIVLSGASTRRQRIQRLGRILRTAEGKEQAALYYFYIRQSSEDGAYIPDEAQTGPVCSMSFDAHDGTFCHNRYETAALRALREISERTANGAKREEARRCLMEGLALPDWLCSPEACERQIAAAQDAHRKNYWICMKKMSLLRQEDRSGAGPW